MTEVIFENDDLKILENEHHYVVVSDNIRVVCDDECKIKWVCIRK